MNEWWRRESAWCGRDEPHGHPLVIIYVPSHHNGARKLGSLTCRRAAEQGRPNTLDTAATCMVGGPISTEQSLRNRQIGRDIASSVIMVVWLNDHQLDTDLGRARCPGLTRK
jgi:hypothetical protein